jgi:glycosyltransferase involved in cell wall biosynthesis
MTSSIDPSAPASSDDVLAAGWRARREQAQEQVVPEGQVVVSCPAPFGAGGLGRHLKEIADAIDRRGRPAICMCGVARGHMTPSASPLHHELRVSNLATSLGRYTRFSPSWNHLRRSIAFDGFAAQRLPTAEHLIAFNGQALKQLDAARRAGYTSVSVLSANSHLRNVVRQHAKAHRLYPLEGSWATHVVRRSVKEYARADRIYVGSRYTWESFVAEGCPEDKLSLFPFVADPRFAPGEGPLESDTFDVVFIGRLSVDKGVPLLVDAVRRLAHRDLRLALVGGWSSRGMRRFLQEAAAGDSRIAIGPGDPLGRLRGARLCAHPTYEDGFAYAPLEAMACGVPVLVSQDTGMKELVDPGVNGMVLPTGDLPALTEAIDAAYRGEILSSATDARAGDQPSSS